MRSVKGFIQTYRIARITYIALETGAWGFILFSLLYFAGGWVLPYRFTLTPSLSHQGRGNLIIVILTTAIIAARVARYVSIQTVIKELTKKAITIHTPGVCKLDDIQNAYELENMGACPGKSKSEGFFGQSLELARLHISRVIKTLEGYSPFSMARPKTFTKLLTALLLWFAFDVTAFVSVGNGFKPFPTQIKLFKPGISPQLTGFLVTYNCPSYTGRTKQTRPGPAIETLAGSQVTIQAECNLALSSALLKTNELDIPAAIEGKGKLLQATFSIKGNGQYWFELKPALRDSDTFTTARYPIFVSQDNAPVLRLISPLDNLAVSPDAVIPIVYEISDDFGVRNVSLVFQVNNNGEQRKTINYGGSGQIFDYRWRLAGMVLKPGDNISWRLSAKDNNNITGPGMALTPARYIRITSFEEEHALILLSQKEFSANLLRLLAEETKIAGTLEKPDVDISKTSLMQAGVLVKTSALRSGLSNTIRRMEVDPLSDLSTITEYKGLEKGLEELYSGAMSEALHNMEKLDIDGARQALDETMNLLERMALLSQDAVKGANMRHAADSAEAVAQSARNIADMLRQNSGAERIPEETMTEIMQMLSQATGLIRDTVQRLINMPGELPPEFVNKQAIKELNLGQVNDLISAIAEAIRTGNREEALRLAMNFLKQAQDMANTIKNSATEVSSLATYNPKTAADDIQKLNVSLGEIIKEEEKLLAGTVPFEETFRERLVKHQRELIEAGKTELLKNFKEEPANIFRKQEIASMQELGKKQEDIMNKTNRLHKELKNLAARALTLSPGSITDVRKGIKEMEMAKTALNSADSTRSVRHEQLVLEALKRSHDALSQAGQSLQEAAETYSGEGSAGQYAGNGRTGIIRTVTPGGALSSQPYHIPTADEYQPPKEFREELLQALKEKYPKNYKELIQKYYKRLTD